MSPISATMTAPSTGPIPGSSWTARYSSCPASRSAVTCSSTVISLVSQLISCRSEATFQEYGWGRGSSSSQADPQAPKMSEQVTSMPSLASTPWTWSLQLVRICTSLQRYLVISLSSRISGGAIHASASRPIRSRSARSRASSSSFLTRRQAKALTPSGCARCTSAPAAASASAAQYQP